MPLFIYNTLTQKKEEFVSLTPHEVSMYVCGITPYDETHLGHGRAYVAFDIIRRHLESIGYKVKYIQNVTDIDDKIIAKGQGSWVKCQEIVEKYFKSYEDVMKQLNVLPPTQYVKATEHISDMIKWIQGLIEKGFAYVIDHDVYFEVSKFKDYGKLSKRKLKDMQAGARVEVDPRKKDPLDFALWKSAKEGEPSWESPWGLGRPGWHIECSVMSNKYLGEQFDIHGGGLDLVFPHHENEIAQTEGATGKPWVKYWIHNGFVNINHEKMSKSLGNFFTLRDIFGKYRPETVRFFLLLTHYRSPIDFSDQQLKDAERGLKRIYDTIDRINFAIENVKDAKGSHGLDSELLELDQRFIEEMNDDFNTASAIGVIFEIVAFANRLIEEKIEDKAILEKTKKSLWNLMAVLGFEKKEGKKKEDDIEALIKERSKARETKNFKRADEIRAELASRGIILEDTLQGVRRKYA